MTSETGSDQQVSRSSEQAEVFLSYSRQDLALAGKLAARLKAAGLRVWWDQIIPSGETYDEVTEAALRGAACVVVLWTPTSVASRWVRSEATVALQQGTLLPVMLADCQRPVMFELSQSRDLTGWTGNARDPRLKALIADVARMVAQDPATRMAAAPPAPASPLPRPDRRLALGGIAALAIGGGGVAWWQFRRPPMSPDVVVAEGPATSLLVMPFENLSGDPAQAWFANGMAEEVRSTLTQLPGLKVIGRVSSERFRDASDLAAAAKQLGAAMILTGSVRRGGDTLRVSAQLADAETGVERWSQSYDRKAGDVLAIQSEIATSVATALRYRLGSIGLQAAVDGTRNAEAYEHFLNGRELVASLVDEAGLRRKLVLYDRALAADPDYARVWAVRGLALEALSDLSTSDLTQRRTLYEAAIASARTAVRLAPVSGLAHASLGEILANGLDLAGALRELDMAIELSQRDPVALALAGFTMGLLYPQRGQAIMQAAQLLDPFNWNNLANTGLRLTYMGRLNEAGQVLDKTLALSGGRIGKFALSLGALLRRDADSARRIVAAEKDSARKLFVLAAADRLENRSSSARQSLEAQPLELTGLFLAELHAFAGDRAEALAMLDRAFAVRSAGLGRTLVNPFLHPIRAEPRFQAHLAKFFPADAIATEARRLAAMA